MANLVKFLVKSAGTEPYEDFVSRNPMNAEGKCGLRDSFDGFLATNDIDRQTAPDDVLASAAVDYFNATLCEHEVARTFIQVVTYEDIMTRRKQLISHCRQALAQLESPQTEVAEFDFGDTNFVFEDLDVENENLEV